MKFTPYPSQRVAVDHAVQFLLNAAPGDHQLYAAPTGYGKSVVEVLVQDAVEAVRPGCWLISPRTEILDGIMDKKGVYGDPLAHRLATPVTLRNRIMNGSIAPPTSLIIDETHHESAETYQQLDLLTGLAPAAGYTASPYRGTPASTRAFLQRWGDPLWIITLKEAAAEGYVSIPEMHMLPLVDDDIVTVSNGEFNVEELTAATVDRLGDAAEHARTFYDGRWTLPTLFALPSTAACIRMQQELCSRNLPCAVVAAGTPKAERKEVFRLVEAGILALLHINVISEGVDLKFRRLVDLAPTMSPVRWVQQLGRCMRPWDKAPQYICTNRNILRHSYVLEGAVPASVIIASEIAFPRTERSHSRVLGLEAIGRFKPATAKLRDGTYVYVYSLSCTVNSVVVEYCAVVHPNSEPLWASKVNTVTDGVKQYGAWRRCDAPEGMQGFGSVPPRELTEKQRAWWDRCAANYGLDPTQELTRKSFQVLPVLNDLGVRFA